MSSNLKVVIDHIRNTYQTDSSLNTPALLEALELLMSQQDRMDHRLRSLEALKPSGGKQHN